MEWSEDLQSLSSVIAAKLFHRPEPKVTFVDFVRGLLADVPRKNSWQIADYLGYESPSPLEWLLNGAVWDADELRNVVPDYVVANLGSPAATPVADDTQVIKKGRSSRRVGSRSGCPTSPRLPRGPGRGKNPVTAGKDAHLTQQPLVRPSINEIRHLLARAFITPASDPEYLLRASLRRRLHQTRAKINHYRSRGDPIPQELRM